MGFDVSYHPIKEQEIQEWYFDVLNDESKIDNLAKEFEIDDFYKQKYFDTVSVGKKTQPDEYFDNTHGYYVAVIQGLFRIYFYTRGSAFSFLVEKNPIFKNYTKSWQEICKTNISNPIKNKITDNYSSGVYISADQVRKLLEDYHSDERMKQELDNFYSHKRINVFLNALRYCTENNMGLLEATEVVEPDPLNLNNSKSYSNLFNCDREGAFLYEEAALEQIRAIEEQNNIESGEISKNAEYVRTNVGEAEKNVKRGFWKKLFGK